jgi:hypothetical protein
VPCYHSSIILSRSLCSLVKSSEKYKLISKGQYCLALYPTALELWCAKANPPAKLQKKALAPEGNFICFFQMPRAVADGEVRRFLAITAAKNSYAWSIDFSAAYGSNASKGPLVIKSDCSGQFPADNELYLVTPVDPMGWKATFATDALDVYTREVLVTLSAQGILQTWTTNLTLSTPTLTWLNLSSVETRVVDARLVQGTSEKKVAVGYFLPLRS